MTASIEYKVTGLWHSPERINGFEQMVFNIFFDIIATDDAGNKGFFSGSCNLEPAPEGTENYTPYINLTELQLIDWVKSHYDTAVIDNMEQQAIASIKVSGLPWS
jgi:hypothetical protein